MSTFVIPVSVHKQFLKLRRDFSHGGDNGGPKKGSIWQDILLFVPKKKSEVRYQKFLLLKKLLTMFIEESLGGWERVMCEVEYRLSIGCGIWHTLLKRRNIYHSLHLRGKLFKFDMMSSMSKGLPRTRFLVFLPWHLIERSQLLATGSQRTHEVLESHFFKSFHF